MKLVYAGFCVALSMVLLVGCQTLSGQPEFRQANIAPKSLRPGDTAIITIKVEDRHQVISRIEGFVHGYPTIVLRLRDDGVEPDEIAKDGIWTMRVDVPYGFEGPPGEFELEFTAYRSDGLPVEVRLDDGTVTPLTKTIPLLIEYQ